MILPRRVFLILFAFLCAFLAAPLQSAAHDSSAPSRLTHKDALGFPVILSEADADLYRNIFRLQEDGKWKAADKLIAKLDERLLMGHVLAQRYLHPTKYRSSYKELKSWMAKYADHPYARWVYTLARKRQIMGWREPKPPASVSGPGYIKPRVSSPPKPPRKKVSRSQRRLVSKWKRQVQENLSKGYTLRVKRLLLSKKAKALFNDLAYDQTRAKLAARYFKDGRDEWAVKWAGEASARSGAYVPEASWTAGLASWRLRRYDEAAVYFAEAALSQNSSPWMISAGAFWAARSYLVGRQPKNVTFLLEVAAEHPRTFYGLLAARLLGRPMPFNWSTPDIEQSTLKSLNKFLMGRRALALLQVGENRRAERELRNLSIIAGGKLAKGIMLVASRAGMPSLSMRLVEGIYPDGGAYDVAAYPLPGWKVKDGYSIDRALIYALVRQESRFNPKAKSGAGARGLMQIMPSTASFVARDRRFRRSKQRALFEPDINLALGQKYIGMLLNDGKIKGNMFLMAAAWNGGPGNLSKWRRTVDHLDDSLFFIETLPSRETRVFIERVFTNLWIYRNRLGQSSPSLDAIAAGRWPVYIAQDGDSMLMAENGENRRRAGLPPR